MIGIVATVLIVAIILVGAFWVAKKSFQGRLDDDRYDNFIDWYMR